jgi:hypothetical protein
MFISGNTVRLLVRRDQIANASSFRWSCGAQSSDGTFDEIEVGGSATVSPGYHPAGVPTCVMLDASQCLRDGLTAISVHPRIYDGTGQRLSLGAHNISLCAYQDVLTTYGEFMYAKPGSAGLTHVTALVDGVVSYNKCRVMVGSILLRPSAIYLDTLTQTSRQITIEARDASGAPISLLGHSFQWSNDTPDVASVTADGVVNALPAGEGRQTFVAAVFDDVYLYPWCVVRVVKGGVLTPQPSEYRGRWVSFFLPGSISVIPEGMTLDQMMQQWDVLSGTDAAYRIIYHLTRLLACYGARKDLAAIHEDDVFRICSVSGNPVSMGFDVRVPTSCIQHGTLGPHFGIMAHEMAHGFLGGGSPIICRAFFAVPATSLNSEYAEGFATLVKMCAMQRIVYGPRHCGASQALADALLDPLLYASLAMDRIGFVENSLPAYVADGSHYENITSPVLDGIFMVLADQYGWEIYPRFFSAFLPTDTPLPFGFLPQTETDRASLLVTALSAAAGEDLRPRFRDEWGFPIDDVLYGTLYPELERRIADRAYEHYQRFDDVPDTNSAVRHIAAIADAGIAGGTSASPPLFSPWAGVTRAQMAKFLCIAAGKEPLNHDAPTFADVPKSLWAYGYIERLADAASWGGTPPTSGCKIVGTAKYFCPFELVTREQMAKFLCIAAGKEPMPSCNGRFADVPSGSLFCTFIERLADAASWPGGNPVTAGCACPSGYPPGSKCYCPKSNVTRGQMAVFLVRVFRIPL